MHADVFVARALAELVVGNGWADDAGFHFEARSMYAFSHALNVNPSALACLRAAFNKSGGTRMVNCFVLFFGLTFGIVYVQCSVTARKEQVMREIEALAYIRQSKTREKQEHSEGYQRHHLTAFHDMKVATDPKWPKTLRFFIDVDVSGSRYDFFRRPAGIKLRQHAFKGDVILAHRLDRLSRNVVDGIKIVEHFTKHQIPIHVLDLMGFGAIDTQSAAGKLVFHVLLAVSEMESGKMSERIKSTIKMLKASGLRYSQHPQLFKKFGPPNERGIPRLVPDKEFEITAMRVMQWRAQKLTYKQILDLLIIGNYPVPEHYKSRVWTAWMVKKLIEKMLKLQREAA